jgi:tRNA 2-thiouridine synthesizing protein E
MELDLDKEGFLRDLDQWDEEAAAILASNEGVELTAAHWEILRLLREFYRRYQSSPASRALSNYVKRELDAEKARSAYLMRLFGGSAAKTAAKLAGLPKPDNCL